MATAITTQSTDFKLLGTEFLFSPVPEGELHSGVEANLAVDVYIPGFFKESGRSYVLRVELEDNSKAKDNSPNSYVGPGYRVFVTNQTEGVPSHREYMFIYNHESGAIFEHDPTPFTVAVEQMIGAALYYLFIYSKRNGSSLVEIPTLQQWLEEWHEIIQSNVRAQMAAFNPARG